MRVIKLPTSPRSAAKILVAKILIMSVLLAMLSACSLFGSKRANDDNLAVDALYTKAHTSLQNGDYAAATRSYQRLIARFPSGEYNEQAQLDMAYAQYKDNQPDEALSTVNRFIKTYPANKHVDYAYYLRGLINFDRTSGVIERFFKRSGAQTRRDQGYNLQAFDDFSELSRRFPDSA